MVLLAVYGTLKQGYYNYQQYLQPKKPLMDGFFQIPYKLYSNGRYPMIIQSEEITKIYLEVYQINDELLEQITRLEEPYGYHKEQIELAGKQILIYVYDDTEPPNEFFPVVDGNWIGTIPWE